MIKKEFRIIVRKKGTITIPKDIREELDYKVSTVLVPTWDKKTRELRLKPIS